jgi:hypothetical protein
MYKDVCAGMYEHKNTHERTHIYTYTQKRARIFEECMGTQRDMRERTRGIRVHTDIYMHTYKYIYAHKHTRENTPTFLK